STCIVLSSGNIARTNSRRSVSAAGLSRNCRAWMRCRRVSSDGGMGTLTSPPLRFAERGDSHAVRLGGRLFYPDDLIPLADGHGVRGEAFVIGQGSRRLAQRCVALAVHVADAAALEEIPHADRGERAPEAARGQNGVKAETVVAGRDRRVGAEQD